MKISDIFNKNDRAILSFEVFPPKKTSPISSALPTAQAVREHTVERVKLPRKSKTISALSLLLISPA